MAENVGRVELIVDADGRRLPKQIRDIGRKAGQQGGLQMSKGFQDALSKLGRELADDMDANGELAGISFTRSMESVLNRQKSRLSDTLAEAFGTNKGLDDFAKQMGGVEPAITSLREQMEELRKRGGLNEVMWNRNSVALNQWAKGARIAEAASKALADEQDRQQATMKRLSEIERVHGQAIQENIRFDAQKEASLRRLGALQIQAGKINEEFNAGLRNGSGDRIKLVKELDDMGDAADRNNGKVRSFGKGLSHNGKQVVFWSSVIAGASGNIAVLGSAAGSSLAILGGSAVSAGVGIGVAVSAFRGLTGKLSELPASVRPAAAAFQELGGVFDKLQDKLQVTAMAGMGPQFEALGGLVERLGPSFDLVAQAVNRVMGEFIGALTSAKGFEILNNLVAGSAGIFDSLSMGIGSLVAAIGQILSTAQPFILDFANAFAFMMQDFNAWTQSVEGQTAITTFFEHGQQVMGPFMDLLGSVGKMLASLVTPETIKMTVDFINNLSEFMPVLGGILGVIAKLDVFGVLSELLLALGDALTPILPDLAELAGLIRDFLIDAFEQLSPIIGDVLKAIVPLAVELAETLFPAFQDLLPIIADLVETVLPPLAQILEDLIPILAPLIQMLGQDLAQAIEWVTPLIEDTMSVLGLLADVVGTVVTGALEGLIDLMNGDFAGAGKAFAGIWDGLVDAVSNFELPSWDGMVEQMTGFNQAVEDVAQNVRDFFGTVGGAIGDFFSDAFSNASSTVGGFFSDTFSTVSGAIGDFVGTVGQWFADMFQRMIQPFVDIQAALMQLLQPVFEMFAPLTDAFGELVGAIAGLFQGLAAIVGEIFAGIGAAISGVFQASLAIIGGIFGQIVEAVTALNEAAMAVIGGIGEWIGARFQDALAGANLLAQGAVQFITDMNNAIMGVVRGIGEWIGARFQDALKGANLLAKGAVDFITSMNSAIMGVVRDIGSKIGGFFMGAVKFVGDMNRAIIGVITGMIRDATSNVKNIGQTIGRAFEGAKDLVKGVVDSIVGFFTGLPGRVLGAIGNLASRVGDAIGLGNINLPGFATGGIVTGDGIYRAGEGGRAEAIVPLDRPLHQVDPKVRELSAIAQGLSSRTSAPPAAGAQKVVNVAAGAIVVNTPGADPEQVASSVFDRIVRDL